MDHENADFFINMKNYNSSYCFQNSNQFQRESFDEIKNLVTLPNFESNENNLNDQFIPLTVEQMLSLRREQRQAQNKKVSVHFDENILDSDQKSILPTNPPKNFALFSNQSNTPKSFRQEETHFSNKSIDNNRIKCDPFTTRINSNNKDNFDPLNERKESKSSFKKAKGCFQVENRLISYKKFYEVI